MKPVAFALILAAASPFSAHAIEYQHVQADQSAITFSYQQMGVAMDGKFGAFTAQLNFDPANPTAAQATIDVALASIDTGSAEGNEESPASRGSTSRRSQPRASWQAASRRSAITAMKLQVH